MCSSYPVLFNLFTDKVLAGVRKHQTRYLTASFLQIYQLYKLINFSSNQVNQIVASVQGQNQVTSGGVTIVKVGGNQQSAPITQVGYTRRAKLGDSRSTGRLHTATNTNTHRSMTRLNIASKNNHLEIKQI